MTSIQARTSKITLCIVLVTIIILTALGNLLVMVHPCIILEIFALPVLGRYYAICCQPLVYNNKMTPVRVSLMLVGCWVIPIFISFLPIMQSWNTIGIESFIEERKFNSSHNSTCVFMVNRPYALVCSAVAFYVPLVLMVLAYQRIYVTAMGHARRIGSLHRAGSAPSSTYPNHDQHGSNRIKNETKAAKTLAVIMGCFCLCWAPFFITNVVDPFISYSVPWQMWTAWLWLGYINSGLNPFLYAFLNRAFRRAFLMILCCGNERYARRGGFSPSRQHSESVNGTSISLRYSYSHYSSIQCHMVLQKSF
uniref:5-hydroxytryptamine receptor 4 n=1 Tax=Cyprinus carpio TaxID=7962 RepID=A0A8C1IAH0_CYPCA